MALHTVGAQQTNDNAPYPSFLLSDIPSLAFRAYCLVLDVIKYLLCGRVCGGGKNELPMVTAQQKLCLLGQDKTGQQRTVL